MFRMTQSRVTQLGVTWTHSCAVGLTLVYHILNLNVSLNTVELIKFGTLVTSVMFENKHFPESGFVSVGAKDNVNNHCIQQ